MLRQRMRWALNEQVHNLFAPRLQAAALDLPLAACVESLEERVLLSGAHSLLEALIHLVDHATLEEDDPREAEVDAEHEELIDRVSDRLGGGEVEPVVRSVVETAETIVAFVNERLDGKLREILDAVQEHCEDESQLAATTGAAAESTELLVASVEPAQALEESAGAVSGVGAASRFIELAMLEQDDPRTLDVELEHDRLIEWIREKLADNAHVDETVESLVEKVETVASRVAMPLKEKLTALAEKIDEHREQRFSDADSVDKEAAPNGSASDKAACEANGVDEFFASITASQLANLLLGCAA